MNKKNWGMRVVIWFKKPRFYPPTVLRNVTEIHYNHMRLDHRQIGFAVAFESEVHSAGCNYQLSDIFEFETRLETKKEKEF